MEKVKLWDGLRIAMLVSSEGNWYLQVYKEDKDSCDVIMRTAAGLVYLLACSLEPYVPSVSIEILEQLNLVNEVPLSLSDVTINNVKKLWEILPQGHKIGKPEPLFKELGDEEVEAYQKKVAGSQADRAEADKTAELLKKTKISGGGQKKGKTKAKAEPKSKPAPEAEITISNAWLLSQLIHELRKLGF